MRLKKGITLLELSIVVLVLVILATIGIPFYKNTIETSRAKVCQTNLKMLQAAIEVYGVENDVLPGSLSQLQDRHIQRAWAAVFQAENPFVLKLAYFLVDLDTQGLAYAREAYHNRYGQNLQYAQKKDVEECDSLKDPKGCDPDDFVDTGEVPVQSMYDMGPSGAGPVMPPVVPMPPMPMPLETAPSSSGSLPLESSVSIPSRLPGLSAPFVEPTEPSAALREQGAADFFKKYLSSDLKYITCPSDPTPPPGGSSYGINQEMANLDYTAYRDLKDSGARVVVVADCDNHVFSSSEDLSQRHVQIKGIGVSERYAFAAVSGLKGTVFLLKRGSFFSTDRSMAPKITFSVDMPVSRDN